jgi:hypothetical protein
MCKDRQVKPALLGAHWRNCIKACSCVYMYRHGGGVQGNDGACPEPRVSPSSPRVAAGIGSTAQYRHQLHLAGAVCGPSAREHTPTA